MADKCPETNKSGGPCGSRPLRITDPDGQHRCFRHSQDPGTIARRASLDEGNRREGREGKARELAHRQAEAQARADGEGPPVQRRRGKRGPTPNATPIPRAAEVPGPAQNAQSGDGREERPTPWEQLGEFDIESADGRLAYRQKVVELRLKNVIDDRTAEVLNRVAADQSKDKRPMRGDRSVRVRFVDVNTKEDGDGYHEAQTFLESVQ